MRTSLLLSIVALVGNLVHAAVVINTWPFTNATRVAFAALQAPPSLPSQTPHLDAITAGCDRCEVEQCDFTVGYGGSPDTNGETTLDAMILDGTTMDMGAVAQLRRVKAAIRVARAVLHHSAHSILAADGALAFAKMMGFEEKSLETPHSREMHRQWRENRCQPNYFRNVVPAQNASCPPFQPIDSSALASVATDRYHQSAQDWLMQSLVTRQNHDTIGMVALSDNGDMAGNQANLSTRSAPTDSWY